MPTLTGRHFAFYLLFSKITCRDDYHELYFLRRLEGAEMIETGLLID
jgi:hypothetical protein